MDIKTKLGLIKSEPDVLEVQKGPPFLIIVILPLSQFIKCK